MISLSKEEEHKLIQCSSLRLNHKTAGILVALMTGFQIGELCGLQIGDISLTDNTITVSRTIQRIYDKRKGIAYINVGAPKTKSSARTIPIPSLLGNIIKRFLTDKPNHYFLTGNSSR
ncbi:tyrosine-type recombinase/integrase [Massilicoli timonensis]|uniref:tyrosine-type recombinase/integrase n=1 Tax=Massilicoli timonensis TaxID=2015901 RepID=UPI0030791D68